jgi:hypothetical protein
MSKAAPADSLATRDLQKKITILCCCGLRFLTLVGCCICKRVVPLAPYSRLLHIYSGRLDDPLRSFDKAWTKANFIEVMKKMVRDKIKSLDVTGYPPFWMGNDHFSVSGKLTSAQL